MKPSACDTPMVERNGQVIAVHGNHAVVRFEREAACGACRVAGLCASGKHAQDLPVRLDERDQVLAGDQVRVGLDTDIALRATLLAYLVPLAGLLLGLLTSALFRLTDAGAVGLALCGLALGLLVMRRLARQPRNQPVFTLIDRLPASNPPESDL